MRDAHPAIGTTPNPLLRLPSLDALTDEIRDNLAAKGQLGLISVSVLYRRPGDEHEQWPSYDALLDEITRYLDQYLRRRLRSSDRLYGPSANGNGFVILLDRPREERDLDPTDIARVRLRLRNGLRAHLARNVADHAFSAFGCYVGGALMRYRPEIRIERVVFRAIESAFADALREKGRDDRRNLLNLHRVLDLGQVRSVYQPVVDIVDRRILGYEALTRVPHLRFPRPEEMFKVANENNVLWRLERLCRERAIESAPAIDASQLLFLNVEPESMQDPTLGDSAFIERLAVAGLTPSQVVFEMTEHSAIRDFGTIRSSLRALRERGFRLAMDDVGSGYAGLQAIAEIAPDFIKVDMSLVRNLQDHPIKRELISTIRRFSDTTCITLVAEGVETYRELQSLIAAGVRCAQGFLFARPDAPPGLPDWSGFDVPRDGSRDDEH